MILLNFFFAEEATHYQACRFVSYTFSETKPQIQPTDLDIALQGLALIQGQIYNPDYVLFLVSHILFKVSHGCTCHPANTASLWARFSSLQKP